MTNLVETIQKNLQYPVLHKIDPNTQDIKHKEEEQELGQLAQAAIPAVLTGLYKLSRNDEGCLKIINVAETGDSLAVLFKGNETQVVEKVARYSGLSANQAESHLENIADEAIRLVRLVSGDSPEKLKHYMNDQRHSILVYLPASLNLGDTLHDELLDDKTNKMEGPVSNFVHKIEDILSQGGR
jgi:hypothetical protein